MPKECWSRVRRIWWSIVSKAAERSISVKMHILLSSIAVRRSFQEYYSIIREVMSGDKLAREVGFLLTCHSYWTSYVTAGRGIDSVPYFDRHAKVWLSTPICFSPAPLHQVCEQILYGHALDSKTKWWTAVLVHIWYTFFRMRSSLLGNFVDCKEDLQFNSN